MSHDLKQLGIPPQKVNQLINKGIESIEDLLFFFPRKYYDFREPTLLRNLEEGKTQMIYGRLIWVRSNGTATCYRFRDKEGYEITISVFGTNWQLTNAAVGDWWYIGGKILVSSYDFNFTMTNPVYVSQQPGGIVSVYSKVRGMSDDYLKTTISKALAFQRANATFDQKELRSVSLGLMPLSDALYQMHFPQGDSQFRQARTRIAYEQIYTFYENLFRSRRFAGTIHTPAVSNTKALDKFLASLPFSLTNGQMEAVNAIKKAATSGERMNSIISGDVGCGKTLIAIAGALLMQENQMQTVVMAPTLVLATQHYEEFSERLAGLGVRIALLTSNTKKKERTEILKKLAAGDIDVLIGTHSVLSPDIRFRTLGMTIVDEEHKFGTHQKALLEELDKLGAHHISMTATPIPRSYAMTVYGDSVDILTVPDMPKGRKVVDTKHLRSLPEAFERIYDEVANGHQGYLVVPFVEESEAMKDVASVSATVAAAEDYYAKHHPEMRVASIAGNMKQADILKVIDAFAAGEYDLLVSTTIVEVGVNIPNATVIAVLNADRFGLAALHQLRGRVGRKGDQGYCLLVSDKDTERLDILCRCHNGFEIADQDLRLRGPGDLIGEKQSGDGSAEAIQVILTRPKMAEAVRKMLSA